MTITKAQARRSETINNTYTVGVLCTLSTKLTAPLSLGDRIIVLDTLRRSGLNLYAHRNAHTFFSSPLFRVTVCGRLLITQKRIVGPTELQKTFGEQIRQCTVQNNRIFVSAR